MNKFLSPQAIQLYFDICLIIISYFLYYFIKYETGWFYNIVTPTFLFFILPLIVLQLYWLMMLWLNGMYRDWYIRSPFEEMFSMIRVTFFGSFIIFFLVFLDSTDRQPRLIFLIYFIIISASLVTGRFLSRQMQKKLRKEKKYVINSILIGTKQSIEEFSRKIQLSPAWGYTVIGGVVLSDFDTENNLTKNGVEIFGDLDSLNETLETWQPNEVLITSETQNRKILISIVDKCIQKGIKVKIVPDLYDIFTGTVKTLPIFGIPLIEINTQLLKPWEESIKRFIDIISSLFILIIGLPVWLTVGIIVKLESKGPVFFKQERVGKDRKIFIMYKFRSMIQDAEKKGGAWTSVGDPRVTKFGFFLRKSHIDEVPQFWNVLKGEMSIVGPRPEVLKIVDKYSELVPYYVRRLVIRPGITGWWQVNYTSYVENKEEIINRLKDDFYYIENMSLKLDIEIMIRTVFQMIKGHGQS